MDNRPPIGTLILITKLFPQSDGQGAAYCFAPGKLARIKAHHDSVGGDFAMFEWISPKPEDVRTGALQTGFDQYRVVTEDDETVPDEVWAEIAACALLGEEKNDG